MIVNDSPVSRPAPATGPSHLEDFGSLWILIDSGDEIYQRSHIHERHWENVRGLQVHPGLLPNPFLEQ